MNGAYRPATLNAIREVSKMIKRTAKQYEQGGSQHPIREAIDQICLEEPRNFGWHPVQLPDGKAAAFRAATDERTAWMLYPLDEHPDATTMTPKTLKRLTDGFVAGLNAAENDWETA